MAKKGKGPRMQIGLVCTKCKHFNYLTERNKNNTEKKIELMKYCRKCHERTLHKETQKLK